MYARPLSPKTEQSSTTQTHNTIINELTERLNLSCSICSHPYNPSSRKPKIICRRQHTYCQECLILIQKTRPFRCPECRFKVYQQNIFVNRALLDLCDYLPLLRQDIDSKITQNQQLKAENHQLKAELLRLKHKMGQSPFHPSTTKTDKQLTEQKQSISREGGEEKKRESRGSRRTVTLQKVQPNAWLGSPGRKLLIKKESYLRPKANNPQLELDFRRGVVRL